jgi:hypothetical protein
MAFPPRPIDSTLHGVTDYSVGTTLMTVLPKWAGVEGTESARQIRAAGAIHAGYSTITNYPLGVVKLLPFKAHLALDAIGALALAATPFVTGQWKKGTRHWVPHVALCVFELSSLVMTDPTGKGDFHGDIDSVRESNMEDPHRKIYDGPPAVRRGTSAGTDVGSSTAESGNRSSGTDPAYRPSSIS